MYGIVYTGFHPENLSSAPFRERRIRQWNTVVQQVQPSLPVTVIAENPEIEIIVFR